jgi:ABC-type antimicrobial peptide transport system permease subunit
LLAIFASIALVLALTGVYGVLAYTLSRRTSEIGLRLALGATRSQILRLSISQGMRPVFIGIVIGLALSFLFTRYLASLLFGVPPTDGITYAAVILVVVATGLISCYVPAVLAAHVDPATALRTE